MTDNIRTEITNILLFNSKSAIDFANMKGYIDDLELRLSEYENCDTCKYSNDCDTRKCRCHMWELR